MPLLLTLFAIDKSMSALGFLGFREARRRAAIRKSVMNWDQNGIKTPFVDRRLAKLAHAKPWLIEKKTADFIIAFVRNIVHREAFEHLVRGLCYHRSGMRKRLGEMQRKSAAKKAKAKQVTAWQR